MENFIILLLSFALGFLCKKSKRLPENMSTALNAYIIHVSLPALILIHLPKIHLSWEILLPVSMSWIVFGLGYLFFQFIGKFVSIPKITLQALILCAGLGNTSFLGFSMIETYYGKSGIPIGILCDSPGTFLVLSLLGIPYVFQANAKDLNRKEMILKVVQFPPFIAFVVAILCNGINWPSLIESSWKVLASTLVPLALFSIGFRFELQSIRSKIVYIVLGLLFKMFLAPICILLYLSFWHLDDSMHKKIIVFEAAMPPMVTAAIVATENNLDPDLAAGLVSVGLLLSFFTLFVWHKVLVYF
jgi:predicted permease